MSRAARGYAELPAGVEPFLDRKEAAAFLRCSISHVDRLVREQGLLCFDIAPSGAERRLLRFCPRELRRWARGCHHNTGSEIRETGER